MNKQTLITNIKGISGEINSPSTINESVNNKNIILKRKDDLSKNLNFLQKGFCIALKEVDYMHNKSILFEQYILNQAKIQLNIESYNRFKKKWIDAQKHVNQMAKDAEVAMNISLESFKNVLIIGKFTNQFELNDNGGTGDTQSKINVEYNLFGRTRDYPKDMRAKYGIVYGSKCPINLTNYGDIRVVFKKEKLQDVTVTGDDTANSKYYASLLSDFKLTSLINNYHFTNEYKSGINSEIDVNQIDIYLDRVLHSDQLTQLSIGDNRYGYLEAQIHGPLLVNDIKEIILKSNQSIDSGIEQLIKNIGISVAYK